VEAALEPGNEWIDAGRVLTFMLEKPEVAMKVLLKTIPVKHSERKGS